MTLRYQPCAAHEGRHLDVGGQCVHPRQPYAFRMGVCPTDGCFGSVARRLDLRTGQTVILEAGSDVAHRHVPAVDAAALTAGLVAGIVEGFRANREEIRREQDRAREGRR